MMRDADAELRGRLHSQHRDAIEVAAGCDWLTACKAKSEHVEMVAKI